MAEGFRTEDGVILPLDGEAPAGTEPGIYGIRPEHPRLDLGGIEVKLVVVEPTGSETMVVARLCQQQIVGVFRESITSRPGETIRIAPDVAAIICSAKTAVASCQASEQQRKMLC